VVKKSAKRDCTDLPHPLLLAPNIPAGGIFAIGPHIVANRKIAKCKKAPPNRQGLS
jgi:hypothetical protein